MEAIAREPNDKTRTANVRNKRHNWHHSSRAKPINERFPTAGLDADFLPSFAWAAIRQLNIESGG